MLEKSPLHQVRTAGLQRVGKGGGFVEGQKLVALDKGNRLLWGIHSCPIHAHSWSCPEIFPRWAMILAIELETSGSLALCSGFLCLACHPPSECKSLWRLSVPGGDKQLDRAQCGQYPPPPPARPTETVQLARLLTLGSLLLSRVSEHRHRMKLVTVILLFLGSVAFLGADTARLDASSQFRKK